MKKILSILLVSVLLISGAAGNLRISDAYAEETELSEPQDDEAVDATEELSEEAIIEPLKVPDYEALRAAYDLDKVVMTIDGKDITWRDFFAIYYLYTRDVSSSFEMMSTYYGISQSWDSIYNQANGMTYSNYVEYGTEQELAQMILYENFAESKGVELSDEAKAEIDQGILETAQEILGEGATIEDYLKDLEQYYVSPDMYYRMISTNALVQEVMANEFGESGEKMSAEDVVAALEKDEFMTAKHILFMTIDRNTGETIDEDSAREAKRIAEEICAELQAINNDAERKAKFDEYEAEYNDDPGRAVFAEGYTFVSGTMYPEFETAVKALEGWQVSDVVESTSGYHIIMRIPLSEDALILYTDGNTYTARAIASGDAFSTELQEYYKTMEITFAEDFKAPDPADYLIEIETTETDEK